MPPITDRCGSPDPMGWHDCDLPFGHDGEHRATFDVVRVAAGATETWTVSWKLLDARLDVEKRT